MKRRVESGHDAISTTSASKNLGRSERWISIKLWSIKSQLMRASLFCSQLVKALPNGFLFVSLPNGGMPARIDKPELYSNELIKLIQI